MNRIVRTAVSLVAGCLIAVVIAQIGNAAARISWPDYAAAEPTKAYSLAMLVARLAIGAFCTAAAACVTTIIARNGRAAWLLGGIFLAISLPIHLFRVWADYPAWYHFAYLGYLVPIAGVAGLAMQRISLRQVRPLKPSIDH
ncbi:MAG: hypothetical protein K2X59_03050 [Sphingomonas sp.]|nr:hypothetical protein [Sphingomonas sp.]